MEYLEPKPLFESPDFYKNPSGIGSFSNLSNAVRKGKNDLILTTEYSENNQPITTDFTGTTLTFRLKNEYNYETIQALISYFIRGIYVRGLVTFTDRTQIGFNTTASVTISGRTLSVTVKAPYGKTISKAELRVSQLII